MEYFEDIEVGDTEEFGSYTLTREEILEFAEQFDPQPFHLDEDAAEESPFGGLVASGWHTASLCMRLVVENYLEGTASAGARGVRDLQWLRPVRPGDTLSCRIEVLETDPGDGPVGTVINELTGTVDGEPVIRWETNAMFEKRVAQ